MNANVGHRSDIRIVQVNEKAFIVEELYPFLFFWKKWWAWEDGCMDASWTATFPTREAAMQEIERTLERRKRREDAKNFNRKVVWP